MATLLDGQVGLADEVYTNQVQTVTITGTPTGGTFTLAFNGAVTAAIAFNATAATVKAALEALPNVGAGATTVTGGPGPGTPWIVTFVGNGLDGNNWPVMVAVGSFTGGVTPAATPTITTPGTGYGTYVVPTVFVEDVDENVDLQIQNIDGKGRRSGDRVMRVDRRIRNRKGATGDFDCEVRTKGFGKIFKHMFGAAPVIATPAGATVARTHTFTIGNPKGLSCTLQMGRVDLSGVVQPFSYKGVKFAQWTLSMGVDGLLLLKVTVDAQDEDIAQTLAAASYASASELLGFVGGQITIGGGNIDITNFTLTGVVGYKTDRYFIRSSTLKKEPLPVTLYKLSGQIDAEFNGLALYQLYNQGTFFSLSANFQGQTTIDAGPPVYKGGVLITLPNCSASGTTPDITPDQVTPISIPFDVLNDGISAPIQLVYTTLDTTD
jgi:hypothetical protein